MDGSNLKGAFERCAKYAILCVRDLFGPEYTWKEKGELKDPNAKRRRIDPKNIVFDPMINLKRPDIENIQTAVIEQSPTPSQEGKSQSEIEVETKHEIIQTLSSFFLAEEDAVISNVDEFKSVSLCLM